MDLELDLEEQLRKERTTTPPAGDFINKEKNQCNQSKYIITSKFLFYYPSLTIFFYNVLYI